MLWLWCLIGYLAVTVSALGLLYKIGKMNKAERRWYEINFIEQSAKKEAAQLKKIKNDGKKAQ
ncbi:hypothetical protein [Bacillus cereus group sp. BfR-BA-01700]|uniref:hypothetical protein n=1 Tax=Bacillus cereus group sp. BfR-BA-01700 TaxID=3094884 RepID=UPI0029C2DBF9|nr:hypothetical protein [Bacillus cereus group sp. BfR-BA-01700]MDX5841388.1 hypothetical protein [Bacillus cereus group sp. BfR-BA-01700]